MKTLLTEISRIRSIMGLTENPQLADKFYFTPGVLNDEVKRAILNITGGDNFTKLVTDLYMQFNRFDGEKASLLNKSSLQMCKSFYDDLIKYDKKLFPIPGNLTDYSFQAEGNDWHIMTLFEFLKYRQVLVDKWAAIPNIIKRNLGKAVNAYISRDVPQMYLTSYFKQAGETLSEISKILKKIPKSKFDEIVPKLFSSVNTLDQMKAGIENLSHTLSMVDSDSGFGLSAVKDLVEWINADIVMENGNLLVVKVNDAEAMQRLGCYSSWCFAVPGADHYWDGSEGYAGYGYVYIIFDFNLELEDARFMMVYLPDARTLYLSNNAPYEDVYEDMNGDTYLHTLGIDSSKLR